VTKTKKIIRSRRTSSLEKQKNVSKKLKRNKTTGKKSISKRSTGGNTKAKKRSNKKNRRINKKRSFLILGIDRLQAWVKSGMKTIRKEQRHCLRFKKYKKRQTFCFFKALLLKYPWRTMIGFTILAGITLFIIGINNRGEMLGEYFGYNLQTSIIEQIEARISNLRNQIFDRKKCTDDKYWKDDENAVCNYWLYEQNNQHCAKFNVTTKRPAIGTKICCNPLESVNYYGPDKNVVACPGSDIFFSRDNMYDATLVADESGCGLGVCQFYPAEGYLIKFDVKGNIAYGEQGQPLVVKPCEIKRKVGDCDKDCGGGKRIVTGQDMYCNQFVMTELCNMEPCFTETIVN